ncbi:hypothetical protein Tco_0601782 [Tanacetum coccineum]
MRKQQVLVLSYGVQPTGRILKGRFCLRWVPNRKTFASSTTKVGESDETPNMGSIADIPNQCGKETKLLMEGIQSLVAKKKDISENRASRNFDLMITNDAPFLNVQMMSVHISSGLVLHQMTSDHNRSELGIHDHSNEPSSSKLVPKVVPLAVKTATSRQEVGNFLFHNP